jgi:hypothetical protein
MPTLPKIRRATSVAAVSGALLLTTGVIAVPASATATDPPGPVKTHSRSSFNFQDGASYILDMRSGGMEYETALPAALYHDVGYSEVNLAHDIGQPQGTCESDGAMYWAGQYVEEAVLGKGAAPPDAGDVGGGYHNPTIARDVNPNISAGSSLSNRHPGIVNFFPPGQEVAPIPADGTPVNVQAKCGTDVKGAGDGNVSDVNKTLDVVGSTTQAELNRETGEYTSTGRAYVTGIKGAGVFNTVSSFMQVTQKPGSEPVVSYRMSFFDSDTGGSSTQFGQNGFTLSGSNVPADQLVSQFNSQAKTLSDAASTLGPFGFQVLAPQVGTEPSTEAGTTGLHYITAPAIAGSIGSHLRDGTLGQQEQARFGSVTFTGVYGPGVSN